MPNLRRVGSRAEDLAADYLAGIGYSIVTRRRKMPHGELDIVALDGEVLVFVEVKYRRHSGAEAAVGATKMRNLQRAAEAYRREMNELDREIRYDLVAIDADGIRHHPNIAGY